MSESLLQYKPYKSDFELSSKWKLKKNPISGFFFCGAEGLWTQQPPYFTHKTHCHDLFYRTIV